jgi:hypothetical protein
LRAEFEELERRLDETRSDDDRLGGKSERQSILERMDEIRAQIESSWMTLRLRALTPAENDELVEKYPDDNSGQVLAAVALQIVDPPMTAEQVATMRDRIGIGQWSRVVGKSREVSYGEVVTPDFSLRALAARATLTSSTD